MTRFAEVLGAVVIGGGLLAGCSAADPPPAATDATSTTVTEAVGGGSIPDSGAGVEDRSAEAIVEQTVALPEDPDDQVTVGIQSLTVEGETTVLRLVITPDFASVPDDEVVTLGEAMDVGAEFFGVKLRLLDRENLKEYSVITEGNDWWASPSSVEARNGEPMYVFAVFAAPEDDIDTFDVRISAQHPDFTDVEITR